VTRAFRPPAILEKRSMKLSEFIVSEAIVPNLAASERDAVLRELVASLANAGALPQTAIDEVLADILKREHKGSTGFGKGVAVPHVKHPLVKTMAGTIGRSETGIDFAALDHQPVYTVVLLLSPAPTEEADKAAANQKHLQAMNVIFNNLQKDMFRRFLKQSTTRQAIAELLEEADQGK
jgi:PTS system nitrogen regulatory IIA component